MSSIPNQTFKTGEVVHDKWVVLELLGRGGMGEVYRAIQLNLNREVALKVISLEWIRSFESDDDARNASLERFRREVQVMAQFNHPNVLQIFDNGSVVTVTNGKERTVEYIVMEYIPGGTLRDTMSVEGFYPEEKRARDWLSEYFLLLLDGVHAMHEKHIIHRDLKPENILMDGKVPKIADFGLSRSSRSKPCTQSVDMRGTPPYMSPEHFMDFRRTDVRTDIYALGKILFESIAGKIDSEQIPFKMARLPRAETVFFQELNNIIRDSTAENRNERMPSVLAMKQALVSALAKTRETPGIPEASKPLGGFPVKKFLLFVVLLLACMGFAALHFAGTNEDQTKNPQSLSMEQVFGGDVDPSVKPGEALPGTLPGRDGSRLVLVQGGNAWSALQNDPESGVEAKPLYMDETKITNHQYVDFLNQVLSRLKVESGVVWGDGSIWLIMGEGVKGCDPIGYQDGRYLVSESSHAAHPVFRVTASGAAAYARHFGRRLPTEAEWMRVVTIEDKNKGNDASRTWVVNGKNSASDQRWIAESPALAEREFQADKPPVCSPVGVFKANAFGLRGINMGGEWAIRGDEGSGRKKTATVLVLGGSLDDGESIPGLPPSVKRLPWEAFQEVGFRTVLGAPKEALSGAC